MKEAAAAAQQESRQISRLFSFSAGGEKNGCPGLPAPLVHLMGGLHRRPQLQYALSLAANKIVFLRTCLVKHQNAV